MRGKAGSLRPPEPEPVYRSVTVTLLVPRKSGAKISAALTTRRLVPQRSVARFAGICFREKSRFVDEGVQVSTTVKVLFCCRSGLRERMGAGPTVPDIRNGAGCQRSRHSGRASKNHPDRYRAGPGKRQAGVDGACTSSRISPSGLTGWRLPRKASPPTFETGIVLNVNTNPTINPVLKVGALNEHVTVEAEALAVETHRPASGQVISHDEVIDLPLERAGPNPIDSAGGQPTTFRAPTPRDLNSNKNFPHHYDLGLRRQRESDLISL